MPLTYTIPYATKSHPLASAFYNDCYCFDEPQFDLIAEPFVQSATAAIDQAIDCHPTLKPTQAVRLQFSTTPLTLDDPSAGVLVELTRLFPENDGHWYAVDVIAPEDAAVECGTRSLFNTYPTDAWLCPVLQRYFGAAPATFQCLITPLA